MTHAAPVPASKFFSPPSPGDTRRRVSYLSEIQQNPQRICIHVQREGGFPLVEEEPTSNSIVPFFNYPE